MGRGGGVGSEGRGGAEVEGAGDVECWRGDVGFGFVVEVGLERLRLWEVGGRLSLVDMVVGEDGFERWEE